MLKTKELKDLLPPVINSKGETKFFNPYKIKESLMREVDLNENDAYKVALDLTSFLISINPHFLSTPHIREMTCMILTKFNFEEERKKYTRRGMPREKIEKLKPKSQKIRNQIKVLQYLGIWNNGNIGSFVYEGLKEHFALEEPIFMVIWYLHRFLKKCSLKHWKILKC